MKKIILISFLTNIVTNYVLSSTLLVVLSCISLFIYFWFKCGKFAKNVYISHGDNHLADINCYLVGPIAAMEVFTRYGKNALDFLKLPKISLRNPFVITPKD